MQTERRPQQPPQDVQLVHLVPEQTIPAMQSALIDLLQTLPTPIMITAYEDAQHKTYYTYQVGEQTGEHPFGLGMGATPDFLDAVRFSLEKAMQTKPNGKQ